MGEIAVFVHEGREVDIEETLSQEGWAVRVVEAWEDMGEVGKGR